MVAAVDAYGAPSYGPIGRPPAGICFHTPENVDNSLAQAITTAKWQATAGNTSGGSYHGIIGYDASRGGMDNPDAWVMVRSVPWDQASGGIATVRSNPPWNPDRYPWVRELLPAAAFSDPNRWLHQISLGGKASWYVENGYPSGLIKALAEWVHILEDVYKYDAVLLLHRHFQTDRTDPGPLELPDLILDAYNGVQEDTAPPPAPIPAPVPSGSFSDVPVGHWAYDAVEWAKTNGITSGLGDGRFGPDLPATRGQIVTFLKRFHDKGL